MHLRLDKRITLCGLVALLVIFGGTVGYVLLEGYSLLQAFYMTIITVSTVGYGEVKPLSDTGRIFSCILILGGFATLAFSASTIARFVFEKVVTSMSEERKMQKQISQLRAHCIICGCGRVGSVAAESFSRAGAKFVGVEADSEQVERLRERGFLVIQGNCTDEEILLKANIKTAAGLLALAGSDPENLFITLTARELNPTLHIIARAVEATSEKKLLRAGADKVISLFATAGREFANELLIATGKLKVKEVLSPSPAVAPRWITVREGSSMVGQTIEEVSREMGQEVIGLRRGNRDWLCPSKEERLNCNDSLLILESQGELKEEGLAQEKKPKRVLIVDDNPVILSLYSRLLARAGFIPLKAADGANALNRIKEEKPDAAVIDFMLPVLSGIEICRRVREDPRNSHTKLILFTSDEHPETRRRALEAGADEFITKTAESSQLIEAVIRILNEEENLLNNRDGVPVDMLQSQEERSP